MFAMKGGAVGAGSSLGTVLILLSALSQAGYSVLARKMTKSFHYIDITFLVSLIGFLFFNGWAVSRHLAAGELSSFWALSEIRCSFPIIYWVACSLSRG